ncbi:hypothetical protein NDU88_001414 [Pleurodeles waltl]|uniref:Uncharacterized protein n=1 Tax=Pleurodeles waltl TaxID=8319 RepID=A0AAV7SBJ6_PLEWA|nr:hypothetical protein NDU88_001414 [Pleurodeles waltl]
MVSSRGPHRTQSNSLTKYAVSRWQRKRRWALLSRDLPARTLRNTQERTMRDIMMAIQSIKDTLEPKVDTVTLEVNLIRAGLQKVTEKLTVAESHILGLQLVTKRLEEQVQSLMKRTKALTAHFEDQESRARRPISE